MATGASIVKRYEIGDREDRISLMLSNFSSFDTLLDIEMEGIEYRIKEERAYLKRSSIEELGVRVQTSSCGSITEARAYDNMEIEAAIEAHDFNNPVFRNVVGMDEIRQDIYALEIMRMDFSVLKKQVTVLKPVDRKMLMRIYNDGADYQTVAEEEVIDYDSVKTRVKRARARVRDNMNIFWDAHQRRGL